MHVHPNHKKLLKDKENLENCKREAIKHVQGILNKTNSWFAIGRQWNSKYWETLNQVFYIQKIILQKEEIKMLPDKLKLR